MLDRKLTRRVSEELGVSERAVERIYMEYWKSIRRHISSLPLKEDLDAKAFSLLKPSVPLPHLGRLYVTLEDYMKKKSRYKKVIEEIKNNAEDKQGEAPVHQSGDYRGKV